MPTVVTVSFVPPYQADIVRIRHSVFTVEQGIEAALDLDGHDQAAVHVLGWWDHRFIATGRILRDGHIGRLAVLGPFRGKGMGRLILAALITAAR